MRPRYELQCSIVTLGILHGKPEANCRCRLSVEEDRVLVARHTSSNVGALANDHGLQDLRSDEAKVACDLPYFGVCRYVAELWVEDMQGVCNLIHSLVFWLGQISIRIKAFSSKK